MNGHTDEPRDSRFVIGLLAGAVVGAGLALWLAPEAASELRRRLTDSAKGLGRRASDQYQQVNTRVGDAVDDLARKGRGVRDDIAGAVARGAHHVERYATAVKGDSDTETVKRSVSERQP